MILIVGAGLAGLTCAKVLAEGGHDFVLCEASDEPGGRVKSRVTSDGFIFDAGFQVLLDSYPAARRHLDFAALQAGRFGAGALLVGNAPPRLMVNPLRSPLKAPAMFWGGALGVADQLRLGRLLWASWSAPREPWKNASAVEMLQRFGFSKNFVRKFAQPFFGGVLLDPELSSRADLLLDYLRRFATGVALLPAEGMGALGRQLVERLPAGSIRYGSQVGELLFRGRKVAGAVLANGEVIHADTIVLAVEEPVVCRLLKLGPPRKSRQTAVHYFRARRAFYQGGWLCLPEFSEENPILHAALLTSVTASLAPMGQHLWSVTVKPDHPAADDPEKIRRELAGWFGAPADELEPLELVKVPYALPDQSPGAVSALCGAALPAGVFVTGDAIEQASIDGVMSGGETTARRVIASLQAK
jgi:phytoene dehydrogenase-like protein